MLRQFVTAIAFSILASSLAQAQFTPIASGLPDNANDFRVGITPSYGYERPITAQDMREQEIEQKYKETLKKIPNKKPVNDPWAGVRPAAVADRHRPM